MGSIFNSSEKSAVEPLTVGFILSPDFTLSAFSNFIDVLRLAADDGDFSRQIRCKWKVLGFNSQSIVSSSGIEVRPTSGLVDPSQFDYIVVVGGLLHAGKKISPLLVNYLKEAAEQGVALVGVCTGSFILARAGLMKSHRACVSWFHHQQFEVEFPELQASSDSLFIIDRDRITCAGSAGAMHLAANLIGKHCGKYEASRALRIMLEELSFSEKMPQPQPFLNAKVLNPHVRKAMLLIERNIGTPLAIEDLAKKINLSPRHLERLFVKEIGLSPAEFSIKLRINHARNLVLNTGGAISLIALECGFLDTSHFSRRFRVEFGVSPTQMRKTSAVHCSE
ncbi:GlxA family transcriptional regulator [Vogesella sp. LIG4]|uniref:GlxA family transcriptional regulator n=1 Tax=Vogesella sp. LIG4 TaxID=1192162 RepID=UPI00081FFA11|nr:GlxA family transcriptional regulator [Vogesella sp. LIG4]SCK29646.1 Transcriptional regulator GlxA family, contains an amidase domain and an AraC-type DNA-binding HTH domain [Vogesella sp. LIG4]